MWGKKAFFYSQKQRGNIDPIKIINFPPQRMPQLQGCSTLNSKHIPHQPSTGVLNPRFHHQPSADVSFFPLRRHLWRHRKCKYGMGELAFSDSSATRFKEKKTTPHGVWSQKRQTAKKKRIPAEASRSCKTKQENNLQNKWTAQKARNLLGGAMKLMVETTNLNHLSIQFSTGGTPVSILLKSI